MARARISQFLRVERMFKTKPLDKLMSESSSNSSLKRVLKPLDLLFLGIGAMVGAGIFVTAGKAAAEHAGPAITISFILSGIVCILTALCYAEFASMVPLAGSAYTYCYASLGEIWAWIIGWVLILEYAVSVSAVAITWSEYGVRLIERFGISIPSDYCTSLLSGGVINLPAVVIILIITTLLTAGVRESALINRIIVISIITTILAFILLGIGHVNPSNWTPFMPFGWRGIFAGSAVVFFAYIGFDAVLTASEEVEDPQKNIPRGIIGSVVIVMTLYIIVAAVLTGIMRYPLLAVEAPVAAALDAIGSPWGSTLISIGALCGLTSVILVTLYGQTRIFLAMARDGLLPHSFSEINTRTQSPIKVTLGVGLITSLIAGIFEIEAITELVCLGTLAIFMVVALGILILRKTQPEARRSFRCPGVPFIPLISITACGIHILVLPLTTHIGFLCWIGIGIFVYLFFIARREVTLHD